MRTHRLATAALAVLATLAMPAAAQAQAWPHELVKIIVPFAPGGNTDGIARMIAQPLSDSFGQQFVVENRPGAAGAIAAEAVARAPADGYTLLMGTPTQIAIVPATTKAAYDPVKDLTPPASSERTLMSLPCITASRQGRWRSSSRTRGRTSSTTRRRCAAASATSAWCCS